MERVELKSTSRHCWGAFIAVLITLTSTAMTHAAESPTWEKIKDEDGVQIYKRDVPGSDVIAFKGTGLVDAPLDRVATVLFDTSRAPEWIDSLEEAVEI